MRRLMVVACAVIATGLATTALPFPHDTATQEPSIGAVPGLVQNSGDDRGEGGHPDADLYDTLKAAANARRTPTRSLPAVDLAPRGPTLMLKRPGVHSAGMAPSDSTGAIGTTRYLQTTNNQVGIYDTRLALISRFTLSRLAHSSDAFAFDPDVTWDPATRKFYFVTVTRRDSRWTLHMGYSRSASPSSPADFCVQHFATSNTLSDAPKIGGTANFSLVAANNFAGAASYTGTSVHWVHKPGSAALTSCPALAHGVEDGFQFSTVPAQQTDPSATGYLLSSTWSGGDTIRQYTVSGTTVPTFAAAGSYGVIPYSVPADVPQANHRDLSTLDNRLWQVQQSVDPRLGETVLWTSLTTFGGPGAAVEWFELVPSTTGVAQQGTVSSPALYAFNGSISSDRRYRSSRVNSYGSAMVVGFTTASATSAPAIRMVSKVGAGPQSGIVLVVQSPGPYAENACLLVETTCPWGDYSSMSASPISPAGAATGQVWGTNMWNSGGGHAGTSHWRTENWKSTP